MNKWHKIQVAENAYSWSYIDEKLQFEFEILFATEGGVSVTSWHPSSTFDFYSKEFEFKSCELKYFEKNLLDKFKVLLFNETVKKLNKAIGNLDI